MRKTTPTIVGFEDQGRGQGVKSRGKLKAGIQQEREDPVQLQALNLANSPNEQTNGFSL